MFRNIYHGVNHSVKIARNGILVLAVFVTILHLFTYFLNKDKLSLPQSSYDINRKMLYANLTNPALEKNELDKKQAAAFRFALCATIGETCTDKIEDSDTYFKQSLVGKATNILVKPYEHPPASGLAWSYEGLSQAGFVPQAHAQGIGYFALQPLAPIWKVFRNVAYLLIVLVIVSIGFMIMFRSNISAQTVISIENSLPRIVVALLLITFSFPIAGFLIDLMYILMGLGGSVIIKNIAVTGNLTEVQTADMLGWQGDVFNQTGWSLFGRILGNNAIWGTGPAILSLVPWELQSLFRYIIAGGAIALYGRFSSSFDTLRKGEVLEQIPAFGGVLKFLLASVLGNVLMVIVAGLLVPIILSIIVWVTCLMLFFRIFFMLLMTYTRILLSIIFSPFILLFEAFPGTSTFGYWFKGLLFNLLTFPVVAILILTSGMIANVSQISVANFAGYNPVDGFWRPPFLYTIEADGFVMLVAISILFIIPDIVVYLKKMFGVEDLPFSVNPGDLLAAAPVLTGGAMGLMMRSRSLAREYGWHRENKALPFFVKPFQSLLPDDPNKEFREALSRKNEQADTK